MWETTDLTPSILPSNRQRHCMPPSPVRASIPQSLDVVQYPSLQIVLDRYVREVAGEVEDLLVADFSNGGGWVDVMAC